MNRQTRERLRQLNLDFYREAAEAFDETRRDPWPGWARALVERPAAGWARARVLDVGCGNGRFAVYLSRAHPAVAAGRSIEYVGVDANTELLCRARASLRDQEHLRFDLLARDVLAEPPDRALPPGPFDWIALFGFLHHVPGEQGRRELLVALARRLAPGGVLCLTAWQFGDAERYRERRVPWSRLPDAIDESELEPGDALLRFGGERGPLRYCHHAGDSEIDRLVAGLPAVEVARYSADGREGKLNRYVLLRRPSDPPRA